LEGKEWLKGGRVQGVVRGLLGQTWISYCTLGITNVVVEYFDINTDGDKERVI
jgi:hypothetical protein